MPTNYRIVPTRTYQRSIAVLESFWREMRQFDDERINDELFHLYQLGEAIKQAPMLFQDIAEKFAYPTNLRKWSDDVYAIYYTLDGEQIYLLAVGYKKQYPQF